MRDKFASFFGGSPARTNSVVQPVQPNVNRSTFNSYHTFMNHLPNQNLDEETIATYTDLIFNSHLYDNVRVVERLTQNNSSKGFGNSYDTLTESLQQFIRIKPSDDQLLVEHDYILERKFRIQENLTKELEKLANLIPQEESKVDYIAFKQKQGKRFRQHMSKLFYQNKNIEDKPEEFLRPFLRIYQAYLMQMYQKIMDDPQLKTRIKTGSSVMSTAQLSGLGARPRQSRFIAPGDEKIILSEKKAELQKLELLVFRIAIAVERINYYTMGFIVPRSQNLDPVDFFPSQKNHLYDLQSCMQIQALLKHQIERQEQIEKQLIQSSQTVNEVQKRLTQVMPMNYFQRTAQQLKEKHEFRENFYTEQAANRCFQIWHDFTDNHKTQGQLSQLKVNFFLKVLTLNEDFKNLNYRVTIQLFQKPLVQHCQQTQIQSPSDSWLFTEIPFAKGLLAQDLVMILKVYHVHEVPAKNLQKKYKVNSKTEEAQKVSLLKAYRIINISDKFFDEKMKDGFPYEFFDQIKFFSITDDKKYYHNLDQDYDRILKEFRENEFIGLVDHHISETLDLRLSLTFISNIMNNQLTLRLDNALVIRQMYFWQKMVKTQSKELSKKDPQQIFKQEMELLNLKSLQKPDTLHDQSTIIMNDLMITINSLHIDKSKAGDYQQYRIQVFLVFSDANSRNNLNLKFHNCIYQPGLGKNKKAEESHQTQCATLRKGVAYFKSEFFARVPVTLKTKDLENYKLIFVVYVPYDSEKKTHKITEKMIDENPTKYSFVPFLYAKLPILKNGLIIGGEQVDDIQLPLVKYNQSKYLQEQIEQQSDPIQNTFLTVNLLLSSQQYSTNPIVQRLIEPVHEMPMCDLIDIVAQLSDNDLLIYHTRIMYSLLHLFNSTQFERSKEAFNAIIILFKRFQSPELYPFKSLIQDYSERWKSDRESDKKLLQKLLDALLRLPTAVQTHLQQPLDSRADDVTKDLEQKITHLPPLITLICRLFAREFETQYAYIRQRINAHFMKLKEGDLCIYRADLFEQTPSKAISSKPEQIVLQLVQHVKTIQANLNKKKMEAIEEENEKEGSDDEGIDAMLKMSDKQIDVRISQYQINRQSVRPSRLLQEEQMDEQETHLFELKRQVKDIQHFTRDFCTKLRSVMIRLSESLHEEIKITRDDEDFCQKVEKIIALQRSQATGQETQDQAQELQQLITEVNRPYRQCIQTFPKTAKIRLQNYLDRRKSLRQIFWKFLPQNLSAILNFIDYQFTMQLFSPAFLLRKIEPQSTKIIEAILPKYELCTKPYMQFYKSQLEEYVTNQPREQMTQARADLEQEVKEAIIRAKDLCDFEEKEIERQVTAKVLMLTELISSDCFMHLPNPDNYDPQDPELESIQEELSTKISLAIFNHIKQYKSQVKETWSDGKSSLVKDTTASELEYYYLFKQTVLEKKYYESQTLSQVQAGEYQEENFNLIYSQKKINPLIQSQKRKMPPPQQSKRQTVRKNNSDDEEDFLTGLSQQEEEVKQSDVQALTDDKLEQMLGMIEESKTEASTAISPLNQENKVVELSEPKQKPSTNTGFEGLGATKNMSQLQIRQNENMFTQQFERGTDRRLCFFLNEMEDSLTKQWELKENSNNFRINELKELKGQYKSLLPVLALQHLQNLSREAFRILYSKRPGCLDRLVRRVLKCSQELEFGDDEFYLKVYKMLVIEQFCDTVVTLLCDSSQRKTIEEISDRYIFKSIVSRVWLLLFNLFTEQVQILHEYSLIKNVFNDEDQHHSQNLKLFEDKVETHVANQQKIWASFKEVEDCPLLPEEQEFSISFQSRLIKILLQDLEEYTYGEQQEELISIQKLNQVLGPLAHMYVQIDELYFRQNRGLMHRVFEQIEQLLKDFVLFKKDKQASEKRISHADYFMAQKKKKRLICDHFCHLYKQYCFGEFRNEDFKKAIRTRFQEVLKLKTLYLNIIEYDKQEKFQQEGNLLAQIISYNDLMLLLQQQDLPFSFKNNISVKYNQMVENIKNALKNAFLKEKKLAEEDPMEYICQKQESQYMDQMKEVRAFMHVEDYYTYKRALDKGFLNSQGYQNQHITALETTIDNAVADLVPLAKEKDQTPNQFFDIALKLLSDKRALQEINYQFDKVIKTLQELSQQYKMYEQFQEKSFYCNYYRIKIEDFLPEQMKQEGRMFVYRTPSGFNQEFIKSDLSVLLNNPKVKDSQKCEVKPLQPLSYKVRKQYCIPDQIKQLSETAKDVDQSCPSKFRSYFAQNFKKQFYIEQQPGKEPAEFDEEYVITIYEVPRLFPTMTMIQEVTNVYTKRIPRVQIEKQKVQLILQEIQSVLRTNPSSQASQSDNQQQQQQEKEEKKKESQVGLEDIVKKYITNDDVGGGLPKMLDLFFHNSMAREFMDLNDIAIKKAYLELFTEMERWMRELQKCVDLHSSQSRNQEMTKLAEERIEERWKTINEKRYKYNLQKLSENINF